jgi:hypothetical protein
MTEAVRPVPIHRRLGKRAKATLATSRQSMQMFATVSFDQLLRGGEAGMGARHYARIVGDPLLPSTPIAESPHCRLLLDYEAEGDALLEPGRVESTDYYLNAFRVIDAVGAYFDARSPDDIPRIMRRFVDQHLGRDGDPSESIPFASDPGSYPIVRPIAHSDCYEVVDGHHQLARAFVDGQRRVQVRVKGHPITTPVQDLLNDVLWQDGRRELYQPVDLPELHGMPLVRQCSDRFALMQKFLSDRAVEPHGTTYTDIGSSYGWFVAAMRDLGFDARGVERDPIAARVGEVVYGLDLDQVTRSEAVRWLRTAEPSDVVSCFSVLHHFVLGRGGGVSAEELIGLVDRCTRDILFFDTGQGHELWFRHTLGAEAGGWSPDHIEAWLREHTSFTHVERLGVDEDGIPPFEHQYGRTLFACTR